jgi:hypothetical protein
MEARALEQFLAHPEQDLALVPGHECRLLAPEAEA